MTSNMLGSGDGHAQGDCLSMEQNTSNILYRGDIGIFWDLRRYHLGAQLNTIESVVVAVKFHADLLRKFCTNWLGLSGLNVIARFHVVCDLPTKATLEVGRLKLVQVFEECHFCFSNVGGSAHVPAARREAVQRYVRNFLRDFQHPVLVIISDDIRLYESVGSVCNQCDLIAVISRSAPLRNTQLKRRRFLNRLLVSSPSLHPQNIYFYETIFHFSLTKGLPTYPRNALQILYSSRENRTRKTPFLFWLLSLSVQTFIIRIFHLNAL